MFDGGLLTDVITMMGVKDILEHMVIKDCYEAGMISEDEWKSYLKRMIDASATKEDENGE